MSDQSLPNRQRFYAILEERIKSRRRILKIMKLMEPFFVRAETGEYPLYVRKRLKKRRIESALRSSLRLPPLRIEYCSMARPVPRQAWMTHDAYLALLDDYMLRCIWSSTSELDMRSAPADACRSYFLNNHEGLLDEAEEILRECFGNTLWKSANTSTFSGASYVLEESLKYFLALQLTNNDNLADWLVPLLRLLPRAIPLGWRTDRRDTLVVLVA